MGFCKRYNCVPIEPNDILTIVYTSGSSDFPKGVMISDGALRSLFPEELSPSTGEQVTFSYQPLAWYGGRNNLIGTFLLGGRAGFFTGNPSRLMEELALVRPTVFAAPPSIWNKIYSEFKSALALTMIPDSQQHAEVEKELLGQFSKLIPSRCNTIAIVGALISSLVLDFMHKCFRHCQIEDGYGITECGGVAFNNRFDPTVTYRLESVPEMNFTLEDQPFPRGELLIKTHQMFSGYVNNPTETRAALTDDGFFRTGDIVELRQILGKPPYVYIIDRKKNFFKLSNGQFVSPEYLQGIFTRSAFIEQIFIHGDLYEDSVTAVIVPNRDRAQAFAIENNITSLESDPKFYDAIMHDLHAIGAKESLRKHEIPSRIIIDFEPFIVENGLLTSSLKPCRPKLIAHYAKRLKTTNTLEQRLKTIIETVTGQSLATDDDVGFLATGGNSLAAVRLSRMVREDLGITLPLSILFQSEMNLKRLTEFAQNPSLIQEDSIVSRLLHDAELDLNITIGKPKMLASSPSMVFVTGTTGFVGGFLLFEMLNRYPIDCKFICLVRCEQWTNPLDRIQKNMTFLHLWQDHFRERIVPLLGDLAQTQFGLDDKTYASIAAQIDLIFHCGAAVNFLLPYSQLYGSNVCGTREIIHLATYPSNCIPVQYISTISILPPGIVEEIHIDAISPHHLTTGYGQSKWVAEKLMRKASCFGLPVVIYRLGSMCASANSGACNPLDLHTIFIAAILKTGSYPTEALNMKLDTLPVNFAANNIIRLSLVRPDVYGNVYHVVHPDGGVAFQNIVTSAKLCGVKINDVPFEQWRSMMRGHSFESADELLFELIFGKRLTLSAKQFYSIVSPLNIPAMDNDYTNKWLAFIMQNVRH
ncbi:unnamed protein product [Rotaria sp. Silwood1]|nr:unnamed protein product [Rotaria sp. Silwood1]CAF4902370.1 unnamed protein product [Rotaria sp. Silwood1]